MFVLRLFSPIMGDLSSHRPGNPGSAVGVAGVTYKCKQKDYETHQANVTCVFDIKKHI